MSTITTASSQSQPAMSVFWENVRIILYALALAMAVRSLVAQPFRIPSGSMQPTLRVGDYIVVTKWSLGYGRYSFVPFEGLLPQGRLFGSAPERGDVVVFRPEINADHDVIKRVIGLPGDHIQVLQGIVYLNGEALPRQNLGQVDVTGFDNPEYVDGPVYAFRETLPNGVNYTTFERGLTRLDNTPVFVVPDGHFFMMGDDRDNSGDSRAAEGEQGVGMVPYDNLVGPARVVVASFDRSTSLVQPWTLFTGFRGERFLKPVK